MQPQWAIPLLQKKHLSDEFFLLSPERLKTDREQLTGNGDGAVWSE